jgi:hypothetical protein
MGKHRLIPILPIFKGDTPLKEDERQFLVTQQHLPTKPYFQYLAFGEYSDEEIILREFDTQAELYAYSRGTCDALEYFDYITFKASVSEDRETIRLSPE